MKSLLQFNIEDALSKYINKNKRDLKLFFILYLINILIYGQKLFFTTLSPDDYIHFFVNVIEESASDRGRWLETLFNQNVFISKYLHILPYLHGLFATFILTLSAYVTGKMLSRNKTYDLVIITLLISATPYIAHLLWFNFIISTWLGLLLGIIGLSFFYNHHTLIKSFGFILIVMSIGMYQPILQVIIAIVIIKTILNIIDAKSKKEVIKSSLKSFYIVIFVFLALLCSFFINHLYLEYHHLNLATDGALKYIEKDTSSSISIYIDRIIQTYNHHLPFRYFNKTFEFLLSFLFYMSFAGTLFVVTRSSQERTAKFISILFITILFLSIPLVVNLPIMLGTYLPLRSQFNIGWFTVGAFIILSLSFKGLLRSVMHLAAYLLIATNISYITVFYYAAQRQTQSDIINANQIVNRIRMDQRYVFEPIEFKIVGVKALSVKGWTSHLQAFGTNWSQYEIFKHFTNLKFNPMSDKTYNDLKNKLVEQRKPIDSYPGKNSIIVNGNNVILFLNPTKINKKISLKNMKKNEKK